MGKWEVRPRSQSSTIRKPRDAMGNPPYAKQEYLATVGRKMAQSTKDIFLVIATVTLLLSSLFMGWRWIGFGIQVRHDKTLDNNTVRRVAVQTSVASLVMGFSIGLVGDVASPSSTFPIGVLTCTPLVLLGMSLLFGFNVVLLHSWIARQK